MQRGDFSHSVATYEVNSPTTEDSYSILISKNISLFAVFDGHGGSFASTYAALHLPCIIMTHLTELLQPQERQHGDKVTERASVKTCDIDAVAECLYKCFCQCDQEILTIAMERSKIEPSSNGNDKQISNMKPIKYASVGCCASLLLRIEEIYFTAHCGYVNSLLCCKLYFHIL